MNKLQSAHNPEYKSTTYAMHPGGEMVIFSFTESQAQMMKL